MRGGKCEAHAREYEAARGTAAERGYGWPWRRLREVKLQREPWCRRCKAEGALVKAVDVHHIVPKPLGKDELTNLEPLCHRHHSQETRRQQMAGEVGRIRR